MVWRICVLAAWLGALIGLAYIGPDDGTFYIWLGPPLTVIVGGVVNRGWALLTPVVVVLGYFGIRYIGDPACSWCGAEDDYRTLLALYAIIFAVPAVLTLGLGLAARRYAEFRQSRGSGNTPEAQARA